MSSEKRPLCVDRAAQFTFSEIRPIKLGQQAHEVTTASRNS